MYQIAVRQIKAQTSNCKGALLRASDLWLSIWSLDSSAILWSKAKTLCTISKVGMLTTLNSYKWNEKMDKVKKLKKRAKTKLSTFKTKSSQLNPIHLLFRLEILIFQDNFSPDDIGYKCQRKGTIPGRNLFKYNT